MLCMSLKYKFSNVMIYEVEHSFVHSKRVSLKSTSSGLKSINSLLCKVKNHKVNVAARFLVELELIYVSLMLRRALNVSSKRVTAILKNWISSYQVVLPWSHVHNLFFFKNGSCCSPFTKQCFFLSDLSIESILP